MRGESMIMSEKYDLNTPLLKQIAANIFTVDDRKYISAGQLGHLVEKGQSCIQSHAKQLNMLERTNFLTPDNYWESHIKNVININSIRAILEHIGGWSNESIDEICQQFNHEEEEILEVSKPSRKRASPESVEVEVEEKKDVLQLFLEQTRRDIDKAILNIGPHAIAIYTSTPAFKTQVNDEIKLHADEQREALKKELTPSIVKDLEEELRPGVLSDLEKCSSLRSIVEVKIAEGVMIDVNKKRIDDSTKEYEEEIRKKIKLDIYENALEELKDELRPEIQKDMEDKYVVNLTQENLTAVSSIFTGKNKNF